MLQVAQHRKGDERLRPKQEGSDQLDFNGDIRGGAPGGKRPLSAPNERHQPSEVVLGVAR